jgi:hypothetical protein
VEPIVPGFYTTDQTICRVTTPQLTSFALELAQRVAIQIWLKPANGLAFAAPWARYSHAARTYVDPGHSQPLAVGEILNAIKPLDTHGPWLSPVPAYQGG